MRGPECLPIHQITSTHTCSARANVWLYRLHVLWRRGVCPTYVLPPVIQSVISGHWRWGEAAATHMRPPPNCRLHPWPPQHLRNLRPGSQGLCLGQHGPRRVCESLGGSWGQIKMRHQHSQGAQREGGTGRARERYRRFVLHWPLSWRSSLNGSKGKAPRRHKIKF